MITTSSKFTPPQTAPLTTAQCLAAQQFIQDSLANTPIVPSSTPLIQQFAEEIAAVNGQPSAPTQLDQWLTSQGYDTTVQAVYQAFLYDQGYQLWFWNGVYGNTQVQYPNAISLNISSQGVITLTFGTQAPITINNPVVTPASSNNSFTVVWTFSNNSTAGNLYFPSTPNTGYIGTLQLGEQSPAFMLFSDTSITSSGNANTLAGWQGNYSLQLWGFAPVLTISPDSSGDSMSVALGGIPLQNVIFTPNADQEPTLSWSSSNGNSTSGSIIFDYFSPFTLDAATNTATFAPEGSLTGNSFSGTLTYTVNNQPQTWSYIGSIGKPVSFPLSQFFGYYGNTSVQALTGGSLAQGSPLVIQSNGQGQTEVFLNGTAINDWEYDSAYNLLTWTATSGNTSAAYLTFAPPTSSTSSTTSSSSSANVSPTFFGTLTENSTTQNFTGSFSDPSDLSSWVGSYGTAFLSPEGTNKSTNESTNESTNYQLTLQSDGDLVLTDSSRTTLWSTGTSGAVQALMQIDGNFVLYNKIQPTNQLGSASDAVWSTGTSENSGAYLSLSDDGTLAILSSTGTLLNSLYAGSGASSLQSEQELLVNPTGTETSSLSTPSSGSPNYQLTLQSDGDLVLTDTSGKTLWSSGTSGAVQALMQTDGNFVLYNQIQPTNQPGSASDAVWSTETSEHSGAYLSLSGNGTLAILSSTGTVLKSLYAGSGVSSLVSQQELLANPTGTENSSLSTNSSDSSSSPPSTNSSSRFEVGPALEVYLDNGSPQVMLTFSNAQIANISTSQAQYDQQAATLTWTTSSPINTSGSVGFFQQTAPTANSSYVGNEFAGTLTLPEAIATLTAQTYNYNGVIGQPNFNPDNPASTPQNPNNPSSSGSNQSIWSSMATWQYWVKTIINGFIQFMAFKLAETVIEGVAKGLKALGKAAFNQIKKLYSKAPEMTPDNAPKPDITEGGENLEKTGTSPQDVQKQNQDGQQKVEDQPKDDPEQPDVEQPDADQPDADQPGAQKAPPENPLAQAEAGGVVPGSNQPQAVDPNQPVIGQDQGAIDQANNNLNNEEEPDEDEPDGDEPDGDEPEEEPEPKEGIGDDIGDDLIE
ncbi:MAG: hypothetical protein ACKN9E_14560 [Microcystaceae cyanobacterium]